MPELPEVETTVRRFKREVQGATIRGFAATWPRQIEPSISAVRRSLMGRTVVQLGRRGKHIVFHLDDGTCLLVHLGMTGRLVWAGRNEPSHVRAAWKLDGDRKLLFCDARKFGRIRHVHHLEDACGHLGIEPLSRGFTVETLGDLLRSRSRRLKPLLLSQSAVAGLGNIYVDECLFRARLHPLTSSDRLTDRQVHLLHGVIRQVLREAIRRCGTSIDWAYPDGRMQEHLLAYGRAGEPCARCGTPIKRIRVGQRSTHFCPRCQRGPRE